jgi:peptidoglycan/xylan/chitin deacetylase (PgdA/CDA1 family)
LIAPAILLYHRVADEQDPFDLCISPAQFGAQMTYLRERCAVMSLDDLAEAARQGALPPRAVAVTLDDGYLDNFDVASPILERSGVPAMFFVTTADLEQPREFWWDTVRRIVLEEPELPGEIVVGLDPSLRVSLGGPDERRHALRAIHGALRCLDARRRDDAVRDIRASLERHTGPSLRPMAAAEVRTLAGRPGHTIGAHTVRHLSLPAQDRATQLSEMRECRETLETLLERPVTRIAYPFGEASSETVAIAAAAGFTVGVVVDGELDAPLDLLRLPRIEPHRMDQPFDVALEGFFQRQA